MHTLNNKKILVTGGAGFIGSNLVRTLIEKYGADITVLDDLFSGHLKNLEGTNCRFVQGAVEDAALVDKTVKGHDIVFHLAARNIVVSNKNPREDLNANVKGSFNVFEACKNWGVERVVYSSTSSVFGQCAAQPIEEDSPKNFLNFYSASKYSAEVYAHTFHEVFNLPVTILRYSNVYGPYQTSGNAYGGVICKFIESALKGLPLSVHGNGLQTRDYTYVADAVQATIAAVLSPKAEGQVYNIGTGRETSVMELATTIQKLAKTNSAITHIPNRDIDNIDSRCICIAKAAKDLQYEPAFTLESGLEKTISWVKKMAMVATAIIPVFELV